MAPNEQTHTEGYYETLNSQMPEMSRLFTDLGRGVTPDFLTFMAAVTEMVAIYVDRDLNPANDCEIILSMSQNKCRFCV